MINFFKKFQYLLISILLFFFVSFLYFYKLVPSYNYDSDFGRDISDIYDIAKGKMSLIGPKLSFGGIHAGPYYYYLFAPILKLSQFKPEFMLYFNVFIFLILLLISYVIILKSKINNKYSWIFGINWIFLSPLMIFSSRGPGNAFSYLSILFGLLIIFPYIFNKNKLILGLFYGFLVGIVINFHLINLLVFLPILFISLLFCFFKKDWSKLKLMFFVLMGILISFGPLILFEFRHNFVQFKNTFIDKSYIVFVDNKNLVDPLPTSSNRLLNFWLLQKHFTVWTKISFLFLFLLNLYLLIIKWKKIDYPTKILSSSSLISFILLVIIAKSQVAIHYFFPFIIFVQISLVLLLNQFSSKLSLKIFCLFIIILLVNFPRTFYQPATRNIDEYRNFVQKLINTNILSNIDQRLNIFCARETPVAILGWEYRYFLKLYGFHLYPPDSFNQSDYLLIIQESKNIEKIDQLSSWELDQFGPKILLKSVTIDGRNLYLYRKK